MNIDIVYICDEDYLFPTIVSIRSLKRNSRKEFLYHIFIVVRDISELNKNLLLQEADRDQIDIKICYSKTDYRSIPYKHDYISVITFAKFELASILQHLDRVLYVDSDVLFRKGFEDIVAYNIDNVYVAAVKDMPVYEDGHLSGLGLHEYFNAGVMYLNLKKIRNENVEISFFEYAKKQKHFKYAEQDTLNVVFKENVLFIHPQFKFLSVMDSMFTVDQISVFYALSVHEVNKMLKERQDGARIIHMAGGIKPWNTFKAEVSREWVSYFEDFGEFSEWIKVVYYENLIKNIQNDVFDFKIQIGQMREKINELEVKNRELENRNLLLDGRNHQLVLKVESIENWILIRMYKRIKNLFR